MLRPSPPRPHLRDSRSAGSHLIALQLSVGDRDDATPEHALAVLAARVDTERPAESRGSLRFVDVPMEAEHRLVAFDRLTDRDTPRPVQDRLPACDDL